MNILKHSLYDMPFVAIAILLAIFTQSLIDLVSPTHYVDSFIAMAFLCLLSLIVKGFLPSPLPAFCYATLLGVLICIPETPLRVFLLEAIAKVSFLSCCVPLLTFVGLSAGGQIDELKKMSYKVILIFFLVSTLCFLGASIVAHIGFKITGAF